eukprot:jgi/Tetstr1/466854/TSEL_011311.t1
MGLGDPVSRVRKGLAASQVTLHSELMRSPWPAHVVLKVLTLAKALRLALGLTWGTDPRTVVRVELFRASLAVVVLCLFFCRGGAGVECRTGDLTGATTAAYVIGVMRQKIKYFGGWAMESSVAASSGHAAMERLWEAALDATGATGEQLLLALSVVFITLLFVVLKAAGGSGEPVKTPKATAKKIPRSEVAVHNKEDDLWIILKTREHEKYRVYDVTSYVEEHPGGPSIMNNAGDDSTLGFYGSQHPPRVFDLIEDFYIGDLADP